MGEAPHDVGTALAVLQTGSNPLHFSILGLERSLWSLATMTGGPRHFLGCLTMRIRFSQVLLWCICDSHEAAQKH